MENVTFFGDSICTGQGVSLHRGWVSNLSLRFEEMQAESLGAKPILVTNCSQNGRTTRLALEAMPFEIQSHPPDLLIVQFGLNDCNFWISDNGNPRVSPDAFRANLSEIVNRAISFGCTRLVLNTNHPTLKGSINGTFGTKNYDSNGRLYNDLIRDVAERSTAVILNDMEKVFDQTVAEGDLGDSLLDDGLHLSWKGHQLYFSTFVNQVMPMLIEDWSFNDGSG